MSDTGYDSVQRAKQARDIALLADAIQKHLGEKMKLEIDPEAQRLLDECRKLLQGAWRSLHKT